MVVPPSDGDALHRGDKRLVELDQRSDEAGLRAVVTLQGVVEEIPEVIARAECIAGAVQEDDPRFVVLGSSIEQLSYGRIHVQRHRVLLFRSVELDSKYVLEALGHDLRHLRLLDLLVGRRGARQTNAVRPVMALPRMRCWI
jgi:hypothetical protein